MVTSKPFVKWAGGKSQLLDMIRKKYPKGIEKYCEPFVGGGAVLFDVLNTYNNNLKEVLINDINKELINTYIEIRDRDKEIIERLKEIENKYKEYSIEKRKELYYECRDRYNEVKINNNINDTINNNITTDNNINNNIDNKIEMAVLFIFLNKTCFNGLYRVNKSGRFNVPYNSAKNPLICDEENIRECSRVLKNVEIISGDYSGCDFFIDEKTFVYIDPPYRPLTKTASFNTYDESRFDDKEQIRLGTFISDISKRGAKIIASNSDPKNTDKSDDFFDDLYRDFEINRVTAKRMINSKSDKRGAINELLISNIEEK